jgi:hypothetical protein
MLFRITRTGFQEAAKQSQFAHAASAQINLLRGLHLAAHSFRKGG